MGISIEESLSLLFYVQCFFVKVFQIGVNGLPLICCDMAHLLKVSDARLYIIQLLMDELFHGFSAGVTFAGTLCLYGVVDFFILN